MLPLRSPSVDAEPNLGPFAGRSIGIYTLERPIGSGGSGWVYVARRFDGVRAAVKILNRPGHETAGRRLLREVEALREVRSDHVAELLDWGMTEEGYPFLAMELLTGQTLQDLFELRERLSLEETLVLVEEAAAGLDASHRKGIVHRDVKPANLFRAELPWRWVVLDFGLSRNYSAHAGITNGRVIGTPTYMSPEQALGEALDLRTDVFALAAVAYRALTGKTAFSAKDPLGVLRRVTHAQPPPPSHIVPIHADVDRVFALAMAKRAAHRPDSAIGFARMLRAASKGLLGRELRERASLVQEREPWPSGEPPESAIVPSGSTDMTA